MMTRRELLRYGIAAVSVLALSSRASWLSAAPASSPAAVIGAFYDTLLAAWKGAATLGFEGRRAKLAPAVRAAYNLPVMTRLTVGPQWQGMTPAQQTQLISAFADYSVATYASRFNTYSGERFEVDPNPSPTTNGVIVHTKLIKSDGNPVQLDYLMQQSDGGWHVIDVYLSGTISELATRRSEFSSVLSHGGADALAEALKKKANDLKG